MAENQKREIHRESQKLSGIPQTFLTYFIIRMHDMCMLLDARVTSEWDLHFVNLAAAKEPK